eukprot:CAMPEP_0113577662 /NCGR_PEP_ID=MMETSP0015_2-20120614/29009_1 /TAXON_ID=2838 /ORGANISM="Odontella" /LENGTH=189 /DNA_ID=CAMNT_0000481299 /DNA_START=97 /DNA_END=666 /DNA_ORIENTATION=- /assembly_acc=CAM_ASM_000160
MSTEEAAEPPTKKVKEETTGWESHTLNSSEAFMKADEGRSFTSLATDSVSVLQGIGPVATRVLEVLKLKTVEDLAKYKFFLMARALLTLSETETEGGRPEGSVMNVDKAVDKEYESKSLKEIVAAPVSALEGLTDEAVELFGDLKVKTIGDLGNFKYCRWAEATVAITAYEETKTATERKKERMLSKLQ